MRDRLTWLAYFMLAYYAYLQAGIGPIMPFLATEVPMSYTVRSFHLSAFAIGMIVAGSSGDCVAHRLGRWRVFWAGAWGMAAGAVLLMVVRQPLLTIAACFIMGLLGSYLLVMIQATLAQHHGDNRAIPLTESNVASASAALFAPVLVSQFEALAVGWRMAMLVGIVLLAGCWLAGRKEHIPEAQTAAPSSEQRSGRLPPIFWLYWLIVLLGVSLEWCTIFWGATFLEEVLKLSRVDAAASMTVFFLSLVVGRALGSVLTRRLPTLTLLTAAALLAAGGFPMLWLARTPVVALVGLLLLGIGVANLFPLTLAAATATVPEHANLASARISLGSGVAILVTPQILGTLADQIGIQQAFLIAGVLCLGIIAIVFAAQRFRISSAPAAAG